MRAMEIKTFDGSYIIAHTTKYTSLGIDQVKTVNNFKAVRPWHFSPLVSSLFSIMADSSAANSQQSVDVTIETSSTIPKNVGQGRKWLPILLLPYFIGISWHVAHPAVSVFTGHDRARRVYIDENSLDPSSFKSPPKYSIINPSAPKKGASAASLCAAVGGSTGENASCHRWNETIEILQILPSSAAVIPTNEAIVLVVPVIDNWTGDQFQASIRELIQRLSSVSISPWLAKTLLIVSPVPNGNNTISLSESVGSFLELYQGGRSTARMKRNFPRDLYPGTMIRNVLVVDCNATTDKDGSNQVRILPQGRRGVLPNMDLVGLTAAIVRRGSFLNRQVKNTRDKVKTVIHPFHDTAERWMNMSQEYVLESRHWHLREFIDMILFERMLVMGPLPPHAEALDRGIDSLTLEAHFNHLPASLHGLYQAEFVSLLELMIRALSNLHERLHHSTSLYLLTSYERFVKHEEYLVPNLLLVIPMVVRAVTLIVFDISRFHWPAVGWALSRMLLGTAWVAWSVPLVEATLPTGDSYRNYWMGLVVALGYVPLLFIPWTTPSGPKCRDAAASSSIQFLACLLGVYVHVAIAFGHVSLAFPSAMIWSPLIAFPSYRTPLAGPMGWTIRFLSGLLLVVTMPCVFLVPNVFSTWTAYVQYAYLPLHLLVSAIAMAR
jgi:glycosylphosphatidylinositol transamidase